jgi:hypothetical protein
MPSRMRLALFCAMAIIFMSACTLTTPAAVQPTWAPESVASAITTRSASAQNVEGASTYQLTVTAKCLADEQLVGGGFEAGGVFEYALFLRASYPANNGWTVKTDSISHYGVTVYAYCLRGEPSLQTRIVSGAECPAEGTALSRGEAENGQVTLCAAQHVASVYRAITPFTLDSRTRGYYPQGAQVSCPAGTLALDGGTTVGASLANSALDDFAGWEVSAGGDGAGEVFANCVTFV